MVLVPTECQSAYTRLVGLRGLEDALSGISVDNQLARELGNIHLLAVGAWFNEDGLGGGRCGAQSCDGLADLCGH